MMRRFIINNYKYSNTKFCCISSRYHLNSLRIFNWKSFIWSSDFHFFAYLIMISIPCFNYGYFAKPLKYITWISWSEILQTNVRLKLHQDQINVSEDLQNMWLSGCQGEFEFKYEMQHISHRFSRIAFPKIISKQLLQKVYDSYKTMEVSNILVIRSWPQQ